MAAAGERAAEYDGKDGECRDDQRKENRATPAALPLRQGLDGHQRRPDVILPGAPQNE